MMAAIMLSIACWTAFAAQSPSAIRLAFAFSSFLESPTEPGSTALCTALSASNSEISAPVLASAVAPARSADDESRPNRRLMGGVLRGPPMRREDAEDPVILGAEDTTLDEALVEPAPYPLPESCHDTLGLLAFLLPNDGQRLVQQAVARGIGDP